MHDVLAPLGEGVQSHEESIGGDFPLVLSLGFVFKVSVFELGADVQGEDELVMGLLWLLSLDEAKDLLTIDLLVASVDDRVANLTDENNKPGWRVVVLRIGPDKEDGVHDWDEEVNNVLKLVGWVGKLVEQFSQGLEISEVLVGLRSSNLDLLLELAERSSVGRLVLLEELENLLDPLRVKLIADRVKVLSLALPEGEFDEWVWMVAVLERALWVLLEHILDLSGPVDDGALEELGFVLTRGLLAGSYIIWRLGQHGTSLDLTDGDIGVGQEDVELVHQVLGDEVGPSHHVEWVAEDGQVDLVTEQEEIVENRLVELHEDHLLIDVVWGDDDWLANILLGWRSGSEDKKAFLGHQLLVWGLQREDDVVRAGWSSEKEEVHSLLSHEVVDAFPILNRR